MNLSNSMGLSPSSLRRVLTAHGRSTTPGLFRNTIDPSADASKQKSDAKTEEEPSASMMEVSARAKATPGTEKLSPQAVVEEQRNADLINTPISKVRDSEPGTPLDSYSFYKRSFRVHGKQAWEYAMRDLGSIDTLLNRYGYVEPNQRLDVPPVLIRQIGDGVSTQGTDVSAAAVSTAATGAGAAPAKP